MIASSGSAQVHGYVKSVGRAGAFVALSRGLEARVKLGNLADGFVEDPEQAFPEGQLVRGRVISTAGGRCSSHPVIWNAVSEREKARTHAMHACMHATERKRTQSA